MKVPRLAIASAIALILIPPLSACTRVSSTGSSYSAPNCSQLLGFAIAHERSRPVDIDSVVQSLSDHCSDEYEIAIDYLANSTDGPFSIDSCEKLLGYGLRPESVTLLEEDGRCSFNEGETAAVPEWPEGGLGWDQASEHSGTVQRVCGPLMSARETVDGTFVNIGRDYPSADRFTFIFWDTSLQPIEPGATVCGNGEIYLYGGVAQMEMRDPGALEIWR